jgi:hypothetical protein
MSGAADSARLLRADGLLVLGLVTPDLLAGKAKLGRDLALLDVLPAGFKDRAAERQARLSDLPAGREIGVSRSDDGCHRFSHPRIVTRVWPTPSMQYNRRQCNLLLCNIVCGIV